MSITNDKTKLELKSTNTTTGDAGRQGQGHDEQIKNVDSSKTTGALPTETESTKVEKSPQPDPNPKVDFDKTQVGGKDLSGQEITDIIAAETNLLVYFIAKERLCIQTQPGRAITEHEHRVFKIYDRLHTVIKRTMPPDQAGHLKRDLGQAVFHALLDTAEKNPEHYFDAVKEHLEVRMRDYASLYYIVSGFLSGVIFFGFAGICALSYFENSPTAIRFLIGSGFGALGAVVSICTRASKLRLSPFTHRRFHAFQGLTRSQLGALFGLVVVLCVCGGMILGPFHGNRSALAVLAVLAGYSERFVPELLSRIEKDANGTQLPKNDEVV